MSIYEKFIIIITHKVPNKKILTILRTIALHKMITIETDKGSSEKYIYIYNRRHFKSP